ncbi:phage tail protein [Elizabethkingia anophelis]|nr:phage tail protein [Elizabethkingia anophelis]
MKYAIKRNNNIIAQIEPQGNVSTKIMGEELVNMTFELPTMVKFQIGDSVNIYGANYYLLQAPVVEKVNTRHFKYSLQFGSIIYELSKIQLLFPDAENNLTVSEGNPIGNADLLIGLVLNNANRLQNGWTKGTVIETEAKQVDFSEDNCLSALAKIAEAFEVEYWIDADKSIHIVERKNDSGYSFQYGKNKGLKSITRNPLDGSNIVTRLYASGSEKNIGAKYRNGAKRLKMDVPYLEKNTDIYNVIEHTKKFDEVYPKRIGTVTAVDANNPLIFTDSTMDFDLNERDGNGTTILIQGIPAKVTFQTGQLAGYMLEIKENGYHTATKTFTLNKNKDEKAIEVPSNFIRPKVGDKYIITDIVMPASYVTNAEAELKVKAQEYLDKNCKERLQYTVVSDPFFFRELNVNIALGNTVHFIDADLGLDANLRILSISKDLQNPYKVAFEIGEDATIISIVRAYIEKEKQQTAIIKSQKYNAAAARAAYYFGLELSEKTFDSEGYFDVTKIKPASIDTKLISLGGRMQQFSLPDVNFYLENNYTSLRNTSGRIVHLTIGDTPRTWYIASNTILNIGAVYQYVYVKCQRNGTNANILVTPNQITVEQDPDFFHFEAGYISSIQNGFRVCKMTYGFAQINPQEISIGRWTSPLGGDYIAFNENGIEIKGKVTFASDSPALNQVQEKIDAIQVGGRNLILQSKRIPVEMGGGASLQLEAGGFQLTNATEYCKWNTSNVQQGLLTLSFKIKRLEGQGDGRNIRFYNGTGYEEIPNTSNITSETIVKHSFRNTGNIQGLYMTFLTGRIEIASMQLESGNKATDWNPAPEDIDNEILVAKQNAANAQNAADAASQNAIDANKKLADIANDNIVTPQEKPDVLQEYNTAANERNTIVDQAKVYNVDYGAYNNAFTALDSYLVSVNMFGDMYSNTSVDGAEFKQKYLNYYSERSKLFKLISDAAKTYANGLVDNLQIGARNLFLNSKNPRVYTNRAPASIMTGLELNTEYTVSFTAQNFWSAAALHIEFDGGIGKSEFALTGALKRFSATMKTNNVNGNLYLWLIDGDGSVELREIKVEKGNKATDWTPAPEDVQEQLTNAQKSANTANQKLADIANDNLLTTSEKPEVVKEWQEIDTEYPKLIQQSNSYNVDNSIYRTFYSALSAYLLAIQYDNFTIDTPINGQEFRQKFREYYDGRADLLSRITIATKNYTKDSVNNIQVGGRNLILQSKRIPVEMGGGASLQLEAGGFQLTNATEYCKWNTSNVQQGLLILSFKIKRLEGQGDGRNIRFYNGTGYEEIPNTSNITTETIVTHSFRNSGDIQGLYMTWLTGRIEISWLQLESGNKATDWTPAPEDVDEKIKQNEQQTALAMAQANNAQNTANRVSQLTSFMNTTVDGNVVATGSLLVGDVVGNNAGLTGGTDRGRQSVRMYAGAPYANKNTAPFTLQDDGLIKMHHPNGNKGFELGIVDGKLVFNVYDDVGNKIMEMGSAGIIFANYIPDSWSTFYLGKFNSSSYNPYNLNEVSSFANGNTKQEMINSPGNIDDPEHWLVTIPKSNSEWVNYSQYSAGTSYDSNTYKKYEGIYYKGTLQKPQKPNDYTEKLADGWYYYTVSTHVWKQRGNPNMNGRYEYAFTLFRLSQGQLVETLNYELSGIV